MNDAILFKETLPKYVFKGDRLTRRGVKVAQWVSRAFAIFFFLMAIFWMFTPKSEHDAPIVWFCIPLVWIAGATVLATSEGRQQGQLDGNTPTIIHEGRISIPPRRYRKLKGEQDFIPKEQINIVEVLRGPFVQNFTKKDYIVWIDAPVGLKIVTKSGKKYNLGFKPPMTVREITDLLAAKWGIPIKDPGLGMGKGIKFENKQKIGEFSYEEIMRMNIH
jgi:hypothetical protein